MITSITRSFAPTTVIVSRVQRFYDYPSKIFPVSCTNTIVHDTYFDDDLDDTGNPIYNFYETIAGSRVYVSKVLKGNAGVVVNLSRIRPRGIEGSNGMVSAGVANFLQAYSVCNLEIRRGSAFRNGAVVLQLDAHHPDLEEFLNVPASLIPWCKRGVTVEEGWMDEPYYPLVEKALAEGKIFLYKQQYDQKGSKLEINVCQGLLFKPRSTCTLAHVNLGLIQNHRELIVALVNGAKDIDQIWEDFYSAWNGGLGEEMRRSASHFSDPSLDKQVGLGLVGLGNMLVNFGVKYRDFATALFALTESDADTAEYMNIHYPLDLMVSTEAIDLAKAFIEGYRQAATFFHVKGYVRSLCVEPTATSAYKQKDYNGYVTSPEISPPIAHPETKIARRETEDGFQDYQYPPGMELAGHDVSWEDYDTLCRGFQRLMNNTGLAHAISHNWWMSKPVNRQTLGDWNDGELISVYYRWQEFSSEGDKTKIGMVVDKVGEEFWSLADEGEEQAVICQLNSTSCTSCGE
jgi:Ribonucleotide reductase, barrel domain